MTDEYSPQNGAAAELFDTYAKDVMRVAYTYLKDRSRAEDVCQEVFLRLFSAGKTFDSLDHERAWIFRVTINLCKDQLKSFWARRVTLGDDPRQGGEHDSVHKQAEAHELLRQVQALPPAFRDVILLYYYQGMQTNQIAQTLRLPGATVRSRLKRAREKLGLALEGGGRP